VRQLRDSTGDLYSASPSTRLLLLLRTISGANCCHQSIRSYMSRALQSITVIPCRSGTGLIDFGFTGS
jgi:hypothetical protein